MAATVRGHPRIRQVSQREADQAVALCFAGISDPFKPVKEDFDEIFLENDRKRMRQIEEMQDQYARDGKDDLNAGDFDRLQVRRSIAKESRHLKALRQTSDVSRDCDRFKVRVLFLCREFL